ncbi:tRNA glutamyl-Q(34) synthetase GluQRS [Vandammella animalimorsus]|uniref:Glutamyl-Q tRNA(Asp) synthetase n=1 Tax=Vandammella animalimorsus TaxID=2029117 RepID=A0A2A2AIF6_9BURK|nr:tRNA glutamyl-Q(34) synthetase GluQRS [Vandammella animalimorsus]
MGRGPWCSWAHCCRDFVSSAHACLPPLRLCLHALAHLATALPWAATAVTRATARRYVGRFAPSPTGPMHLGSVVAALASWLDARAASAQGLRAQWLVRIEDLDAQRCSAQAAQTILQQLHGLGLVPDAPVQWQSQRQRHYEQAMQTLQAQGRAYPCSCTRKDIAAAQQALGGDRQRFQTLVYPGTCRHRPAHDGPVRTWRFLVQPGCPAHGPGSALVHWQDRRLGAQQQDVAQAVGDFALLRGDGMWSYQMGCVVDDGLQGVTHIVRGEDLADNTARQILLQQALGHPRPSYLHVPLARDARGEKLSKGNHAPSIDANAPLAALRQAAQVLGLPPDAGGQQTSVSDALAHWTALWAQRHPL